MTEQPGPGRHPLIDALFQQLPPAGSVWPVAEREQWLQVATAIIALVYRERP